MLISLSHSEFIMSQYQSLVIALIIIAIPMFTVLYHLILKSRRLAAQLHAATSDNPQLRQAYMLYKALDGK